MLKTKSRIVYLDLEYINQALLSEPQERPKPHHWKEVVQCGALRFDHDKGCEEASLSLLVKPTLHVDEMTEAAWDRFRDITHLERERIMTEGTSLTLAWESILTFSQDLPIVIMLGDRDVLEADLAARRISLEAAEREWLRLKPILVSVNPERWTSVWSGQVFRHVGLTEAELVPQDQRERG